jgi:hypothetical protein
VTRKRPDKPSVLRTRPSSERRKLAPEFEALARGESDRVTHIPSGKPRLRDPRTTFLVPGVSNRDARAVGEARVEEFRAVLGTRKEGDAAPESVGALLYEAVQLGVWRTLNVTGFETFAEDILALPLAEAQALLKGAETKAGSAADRLSDEAIAAWLRTEVALRATSPRARVRVERTADGREVLELSVPMEAASLALHAVGGKHAELASDQSPRPRREDGARGPGPRGPGGGDRDRGGDRGFGGRGPGGDRDRGGRGPGRGGPGPGRGRG